jgi:ABC-2 type transport system ATP-binding protein
VKEFLELIVELSRAEGLTVLFSSHDLHHVQQVCDRVGLFVQGRLLAEGDIPSLSRKLFTKSPYVVEVGITQDSAEAVGADNNYSVEWLKELLHKVEGVIEVEAANGVFQISCSGDFTSEIARIIVESGAGLHYLNKKEYGLDDIYYRYFEAENHE